MHGSPTIINCTFKSNSSTASGSNAHGGGMFNVHGSPTITNCTFTANRVRSTAYKLDGFGGGISNYSSPSVITNCTFESNMADYGGGINNEGSANPTINNCIVWNNTAFTDGPQFYNPVDTATPTIRYSDIEGGCSAVANAVCDESNIDEDPLFEDAANGDLHPTTDSPCINTGDNGALPLDLTDLDGDSDTEETIPLDRDGNDRIVGDIVDMGAYEYQL